MLLFVLLYVAWLYLPIGPSLWFVAVVCLFGFGFCISVNYCVLAVV